jgi:hypothetical protein
MSQPTGRFAYGAMLRQLEPTQLTEIKAMVLSMFYHGTPEESHQAGSVSFASSVLE